MRAERVRGGPGSRSGRTGVAAVALALLTALVLVAAPTGIGAATCAKTEISMGIVKAKGCFVERQVQGQGTVYDNSGNFTLNGFNVAPRSGGKVTFSPAEGKRAATVSTTGFVDLSATNPSFGTISFNRLTFAFAPPQSGEVILAESALAQPFPIVTGISPANVTQPLKLTENGTAAFDLNFGLEGLFKTLISGRERELSFRVGFKVADGKWRIGGGGVSIKQIELAKLLAVKEATVQFDAPSTVDVDIDAGFKGLEGKGLVAGFTLQNGKPTRLKLGVSGLNAQLGTSGVYLQKLAGEVFIAPPYGGNGLIGVSAGPKQKFFGRDVTAVEADGTVGFRSADPASGSPGFFRVGGSFTVVSIPVGDASFGYRFGQGTDFSASIGIGLPCACNNSGQPTYIGGRFAGWTAARSFDLEGSAKLKVLGISLLGAKAVVSDYGMAGCLQVIAWIGGGVRWSDGRGEMLGGWSCNIGGYKRSPSARAAAGGMGDGDATLRLDDGVRIIRITAPRGEEAPDLTLEHQDGTVLETPAPDDPDGVARFDDGASMADDRGMSAFILPADAPRRWTLSEQDGSSEVETIEYAGRLRDHDVDAEVVGEGRRRTLRWSASDIPFQRLQFSEVLPDGREVPIHETGDPEGERRFLPVEGTGSWGERKLAVDVMQRFNTPRDELKADRYVVDPLPAPRPVHRVRAQKRLNDLVVGWRQVASADRYEITARVVGAGTTISKIVRGDKRRTRLFDAPTGDRLRVSVRPLNVQGRRGRPSAFVLKADNGIGNRRQSVRRALRRLAVTPTANVATKASCPSGGHCYGAIALTRGGRTLGRARFEVPPEMTDRVAVKLRPAARRRLESGLQIRGVSVKVKVRQIDGTARAAVRRDLETG